MSGGWTGIAEKHFASADPFGGLDGAQKFGDPNFYFSESKNINALGGEKRSRISCLQEPALRMRRSMIVRES